jgi:S-adenosyl-L-methionine hydrolase (adenosine-forming)
MSQQSFIPSGYITLTTDFGACDPFVGVMKGVIAQRWAAANVIDLCHGLPKYQPTVAGFWLTRCWPYFSLGTVHLAVVDPGVGSSRAMKWALVGGHAFIAPDNGLLEALEASVAWQASGTFELSDLVCLNLGVVSSTFHGRDVFAPLVAELAAGRIRVESLGRPVTPGRRAVTVANEALGSVQVIDDFGNLLTDIGVERLADNRYRKILYASQVIDIKETYDSSRVGEVTAIVNSWGCVEIAVVQGNAQQRFGAALGDPVSLVSSD